MVKPASIAHKLYFSSEQNLSKKKKNYIKNIPLKHYFRMMSDDKFSRHINNKIDSATI